MRITSNNGNYHNGIKELAYITIYNHNYDAEPIYNIFKNQKWQPN